MTDGLITVPSSHPAARTLDRLAAAVAAAGLQVFARIDHAAGAADSGLDLRPTQLLIFGQARGGTPLMQQAQTAGIDLPLKALAWTGADGQTWLSYNDPAWIAQRHQLGEASTAAVHALTGALAKLAAAATSG
jgi:uncharacterized protein (DUF302 family)